MTEWITSGNLKYYNFVDAFHDLKRVDWRQYANYEVGDIVYIYSSGNEQMIRFKCKVNKTDIKELEIDDRKYNVEGKYDEPYDRYVELEMVEEYESDLYSRLVLEKYGFRAPQGAIKVKPEIKEYLDIVTELLNVSEMDPDKHDGSYELMRSTIYAYENMKDLSNLDYEDLNLVYLMCVGTWKHSVAKKEERIEASHLPVEQKDAIKRKLQEIWNNAAELKYENRENNAQSIGMFGTGFYSFVGKTDSASVQSFIKMCISISHMQDIEQIFDRCAEVFTDEFKGMGAVAASQVLHCLKPTVFPVLNSNSGYDNIYNYLGVKLDNKGAIQSYIDNCRVIKEFRDKYFTIKNYRIFDIAARQLGAGVTHTDINYLWVMDYLEKNRSVPYSNPNSATDEEEKERLLSVKANGQRAKAELQKMAKLCAEKFKLNKCETIQWLDGSNTKIKNYLWAQLKYSEYAKRPESVSIFVDMSEVTSHARFRFSLELKNDRSDKAVVANYHRHLDIPISEDSSLIYVSGSNEFGRPEVLNEDVDTIKNKIADGTYKKVQICSIVEYNDEITNDEIEAEMLRGVSELIPYYEHVLGIDKPKDEYWPSKEEFDPGITSEQWAIMLRNPSIMKPEYLDLLKKILEQGGESTCAHLEEVYGGKQGAYNAYGRSIGQAAMKYMGCDCIQEEGMTRYYTIPFVGKNVEENGNTRYLWKIRDELKEALERMDLSSIDIEENDVKTSEFDKNIILYGPPGTGKTYNTVNYAVAICEGLSLEEVCNRPYDEVFDKYNKLKKVGRIAFTTFHQSYGYEEFIEGIKPVMDSSEEASAISYTIKDGVFKDFCDKASKVAVGMKTNVSGTAFQINEDAKLWCMILGGSESPDLADKCFEEGTVRIGWSAAPERITEEEKSLNDKERRMLLNFQDEMEIGDIVVTRSSISEINSIGIVTGEYEFDDSSQKYPRKRTVDWIYRGDPLEIRDLNGNVRLDRKAIYPLYRVSIDELLKRIPGGPIIEDNRPYVFIIDEINRGNISKIFGELITLIETTKRRGADEAAEVILPYSNVPFSVPGNVYIIGTMNTADRSIALMDTALRRRFQFVEMMPDSDVLRTIGADKIQVDGEELDVAHMLDVINQRIEYLYDREHTIGHAFFTGLVFEPTIEKLASIFRKSVIPLLQEYFYEDYSKIMMVLGDNGKENDEDKFILAKEIKPNSIFRGDTSDVDIPDYSYEIQESAFMNINSYIEIIG